MSKRRPRRHHRRPVRVHSKPKQGANDGVVYFSFVALGVIVAITSVLLFHTWREALIGYVAAMAWLTNLYAIRAIRGIPLAGWQEALARLPLRFAGIKGHGGRPIEAAHKCDAARTVVIASAAVSILVVIVLAGLLLAPLT